MKTILRIGIIMVLCALAFLFGYSLPAFAIDDPDDAPSIESTYIYRNCLETGDMLAFILENTPYATAPTDYTYPEAYTWSFLDTDGTTELAQSQGYAYNDYGYGYNVIGFYFDADDAPAWNQAYQFKLAQLPSAFDAPEQWIFDITSPGYSSLNATTDVKIDIAAKILLLAADLDNKWGLDVDYSLVSQTETGNVLSVYGEAFFRGALYGCQAYAPNAFQLVIENISSDYLDDRTWTDEYSTNLSSQYAGTDFGTGMDAGNTGLETSYNLFGLLITFLVVGVLVGLALMISADWWGSLAVGTAPLVIFTRMGMFGMGELALVAAVGWLFISAKIWKVI
jgi:hypothetical protein